MMTLPNTQRERRFGAALCLLLCLATAGASTGCTTPTSRADHAYKAGRYEEALDMYEKVIKEGSRDPLVYFHAAQAAQRTGNFTIAERYYSRSLRYGGGVVAAQALADFYIRTSNYSRAVIVLQHLLNIVDDPQPVYNNLGTALMYAGHPFDAEAYLLLAQQKNPKKANTYANLGLLYDKHLRQPALAVGFYDCYLKMTPDRNQRRTISQRADELRQNELRKTKPIAIKCGEVYNPGNFRGPDPRRLRVIMGRTPTPTTTAKKRATVIDLKMNNAPGKGASGTPGTKSKTGTTDKTSRPVIERGADPGDRPAPTLTASPDAHRKAARAAFASQNYRVCVERLESIPLGQLGAEDLTLLGLSHAELKHPAQAEQWLRRSLDREARPGTLSALIDLLNTQKRTKERDALCDKWRKDPSMITALRACKAKPGVR